MALLGSGAPEAQDCGVGALANLAVNPRCRELIADANAIGPLVQLLGSSDVGDGVKEMAVGTLTNLAILPANQVPQDAPEGFSDGTASFFGRNRQENDLLYKPWRSVRHADFSIVSPTEAICMGMAAKTRSPTISHDTTACRRNGAC